MKRIFILILILSYFDLHAQNVGIGSVNVNRARFEVSGAVGITSAIFGGEGAGISVQRNSPSIGFNQYYLSSNYNMAPGIGMVQWLNTADGSLVFDQSATTTQANANTGLLRKMTIWQNGNVSLLTTAATYATLFVGGETIGAVSASFRGSQYNSFFYESVSVGKPNRDTYINAGKNGSGVFINDKPGGYVYLGGGGTKVGINTDPSDIFEIKQNGGGFALIAPNFANWEMYVEKNVTDPVSDFYMYYNGGNVGNISAGDGLYYSYSDKRVKRNIQGLGKVLPAVLALKPYEYEMKYNNPGHMKSFGFMAQDVNVLFPEITDHVVSDSLGYPGLSDMYTIDYNAFGPLAIKALQEQQQKIQALTLRIGNLRKKVEALKQAPELVTNTQTP